MITVGTNHAPSLRFSTLLLELELVIVPDADVEPGDVLVEDRIDIAMEPARVEIVAAPLGDAESVVGSVSIESIVDESIGTEVSESSWTEVENVMRVTDVVVGDTVAEMVVVGAGAGGDP